MISELQSSGCGTIVPQNSFGLVSLDGLTGTVQPVADVPAYLATRKPQAEIEGEECLLITLPATVQSEVKALVRACKFTAGLVKEDKWSVQRACVEALRVYRKWLWSLKTFRAKFDLWVIKRDWLVLVNRSKAPACWRALQLATLPEEFLEFVAARASQFKRSDALPSAVRSIWRQWHTGRNEQGLVETIPGYEADWKDRNPNFVPAGWTIGNLRRQLQQRAKYLKVHKALAHEGIAAARAFIPQVRSTREGLRFMEEVQFDDVKCDFRVFDTATGKPVDLWLLIAHDRATTMLLGFGMRPATVREDGTQEHLKLRDMKQLYGWLLERYGLPPYPMTSKVEHGTATLTEGTAQAIEEMLPGRIVISFSSMIGGKSPAGYLESALGNSKGKASLESHNRQMHMIGAGLPGQTGPRYHVRPRDLAARERECSTIWRAAQEFPNGLRERLVNEFGYPLLTLPQARQELVRIFNIRNSRTDHNLEGFEQVLENLGGRIIKRMESPAERANKLCAGLKFDRVSPEIITAFYEHTQRPVTVTEAGEVEFNHEGLKLTFAPPQPDATSRFPGRKALAYYHPDDPRFLHLTDGKGCILGTWLRRALVKSGDRTALSDAIHYSAAALKTAKDYAAQLNQGETIRLDEMRERNNQLVQANTFTDVTPRADFGGNEISHPVAASLIRTKAEIKAQKKAEDKFVRTVGAAAAEEILAGKQPAEESSGAESDDFLSAISGNKK